MARVRVYIACSLDGFIAGPDDDLSFLDGHGTDHVTGDAVTFEAFLAEVGCLLMGRSTYDVVNGFGGDWPYGDRPVHVATHRPLDAGQPTVRAVTGDIADLVRDALAAADGKDVYVDGGVMVRQALDAGLLDELIVTVAPVVLGAGHPLFAGANTHRLQLVDVHRFGAQMVQLVYRA